MRLLRAEEVSLRLEVVRARKQKLQSRLESISSQAAATMEPTQAPHGELLSTASESEEEDDDDDDDVSLLCRERLRIQLERATTRERRLEIMLDHLQRNTSATAQSDSSYSSFAPGKGKGRSERNIPQWSHHPEWTSPEWGFPQWDNLPPASSPMPRLPPDSPRLGTGKGRGKGRWGGKGRWSRHRDGETSSEGSEKALQKARLAEAAATTAEFLTEGRFPSCVERVFVDGNNCRGGGARRVSRQGLIQAVDCLARRESALRHDSHAVPSFVVFFDGGDEAHVGGNAGAASGDLAAVVHCHRELADDVIVQRLDHLFSQEQGRRGDSPAVVSQGRAVEGGQANVAPLIRTLVITSDRGLMVRVLDTGASVMKCGPFLRLAAIAQELEERPAQLPGKLNQLPIQPT